MSEHRSVVARTVGPSLTRRGWLNWVGAALGASVLLGGLGVPVSAGDVSGGSHVSASADVQGNCAHVAVAIDGTDGSISQEDDGVASELGAAAQGTATAEVSVCRDDPGGTLPEDPGGSLPGDVDDVVPGDPDSSLAAEVAALVTAVLDGGVPPDPGNGGPGDPDGGLPGDLGGVVPDDPGGALPGDPGEVVPGELDGIVPGGSGLVPGILDELPQVLSGGIDLGGPGIDGGDAAGPAISPSAGGTGSGSVAVDVGSAEGGAPTDPVLGAELERGVPASVGTAVSPGTALPRTGGGLGTGVLRLIALLGLGRALVGLANRSRPAPGEVLGRTN